MSDEQLSRELSSLKDTMVDFRNEMRAAMTGVVRLDVYQAQQETLRAQMAKDVSDLRGEIQTLRATVSTLEQDKRQNRGLLFSALGAAAVSLIMAFTNLK